MAASIVAFYPKSEPAHQLFQYEPHILPFRGKHVLRFRQTSQQSRLLWVHHLCVPVEEGAGRLTWRGDRRNTNPVEGSYVLRPCDAPEDARRKSGRWFTLDIHVGGWTSTVYMRRWSEWRRPKIFCPQCTNESCIWLDVRTGAAFCRDCDPEQRTVGEMGSAMRLPDQPAMRKKTSRAASE